MPNDNPLLLTMIQQTQRTIESVDNKLDIVLPQLQADIAVLNSRVSQLEAARVEKPAAEKSTDATAKTNELLLSIIKFLIPLVLGFGSAYTSIKTTVEKPADQVEVLP